MMCVLGVGVSSGLGPVLVVWAPGQCGGSVMMRAVFGAQLSSCQLPAAAACVDAMSHVGSRPFNGGSLGYLHLRHLLSYVLCRTLRKTAPEKIEIIKLVCRVHVAGKPQKHVLCALILPSTMYSCSPHDERG